MMILFKCWDRFDLRDSLGKVIITALRQMNFVSHPLEASLFAVANFCIVGRANPLSNGRHLFWGQARDLSLLASIVLLPDL
jgi:hypothetical protein